MLLTFDAPQVTPLSLEYSIPPDPLTHSPRFDCMQRNSADLRTDQTRFLHARHDLALLVLLEESP